MHQYGQSGLVNLGNTCFINSTIQILRNTKALNLFLDNTSRYELLIKNIPERIIFQEWNDLRKLMNSQSTNISPKRFIYQVQQVAKIKKLELFTTYSQNDLTEFLLFVIDCLHTTVSRGIDIIITGNGETEVDKVAINCYQMLKNKYEKDYSEIMDIFYGVLISEILSIDAKILHSTKSEQYFTLDLELPEDKDAMLIYDCLDEFTCSEILDEENAWFNEKTGKKEDVQKRIRFWNLPKVLIITLKRFTYDRQKINTFIKYPTEGLDLSKYVSGYNPSQYIYDLYGVCCHYGILDGGHYSAIVKNGNEWVHYNDDQLHKVSDEKVVSRQAYCLFYNKRINN
jgi:ubiquitin carboxyl-terminal hydrolase 8